VNEAAAVVVDTADKGANIIFGAVVDPSMGDEVRVTVIATGFEGFELLVRKPAEVRRRSRQREIAPDQREIRSLEVSDDDIDVPSFLKD
jgi:cell division protein FtsZ